MNLTIRTKLMLALCIPITIVGIILTVMDYYEQRGIAIEQARNKYVELVKYHAATLDQRFLAIERMAELSAEMMGAFGYTDSQDIDKLLKTDLASEDDIYISFVAFKPGVMENRGLYAPMWQKEPDGSLKHTELQIDERTGKTRVYTCEDWFLIPELEKKPSWGEPFIEGASSKNIICAYSVPFFRDGQFAGVLGVDVMMADLNEKVQSMFSETGGYGVLISSCGTVMAHADKNLIMRHSIFSVAEKGNLPELYEAGSEMLAGKTGIVKIGDYKKVEDAKWMVYTPLQSTGWSLMMVIPEQKILAPMMTMLVWRTVQTLIILGVIIIMLAVVAYSFTKNMAKLANSADEIAAGDLGLAKKSIKLISSGNNCASGKQIADESKRLVCSMSTMVDKLNSLVSRSQASSRELKESSGTISSQVRELEIASTERAASTNQVVASAKEIAATTQELVQTMQSVSQATANTEQIASRGKGNLEKMHEAMSDLTSAAELINEKLTTIHDKAENITCVITTIVQVADRTNLLSLNAAIEAEQAGENGKGFAIVANEIRRLADQTAAATLHIEKIVKEMLDAVITGVKAMARFRKDVQDDSDTVNAVSDQMGDIITQVQALGPKFGMVYTSMDSQSVAARQISEAMAEIGQEAQMNVSALNELNQIAQTLHHAAEQLQQEVSFFKTTGEENEA